MYSMLKSTFSILLISACTVLHGQVEAPTPNSVNENSGLRLGVDLAKYIYEFVEPAITGFEASLDYEIKPNLFINLEGGYEKAEPRSKRYNYELRGVYSRLGVDYNLIKNRADNDIFFLGLRYGISRYTQTATNIEITNYWGTAVQNLPDETIYGHWAEAVVGMKTELFFAKNIFIGWTIRGRVLVAGNEYETVRPFTIPGFGPTENKATIGATWSLYYNIPVRF